MMQALQSACVPRLAPGVRLHRDPIREQWQILAPEQVIVLNEVAHDVLQLVDGQRTVAQISEELASAYEDTAEQIQPDVIDLLEGLIARGWVRL